MNAMEDINMLLDCGHEESPHSSITRGYGITKDGQKHCYECCAQADRMWMRVNGKITLYLDMEKEQVTNWPGSLFHTIFNLKRSRHNWAGYRYDFHFVSDGFYWHGYSIGDNTQIAHCKRTKDIYPNSLICFL